MHEKNFKPMYNVFDFFQLHFAQSQVFDNLKMDSEILNMERKYSIYLPPDYEISS